MIYSGGWGQKESPLTLLILLFLFGIILRAKLTQRTDIYIPCLFLFSPPLRSIIPLVIYSGGWEQNRNPLTLLILSCFFFLYIILRAKLTQRTHTHVHTLPVSILASPSSIIQEVEDKTEAPKQTPIYLALCWFGRPFGQFVRSFPLWPLDRLSIIVCMLSVRGQRWMGGEIHHNGRKELVLARTCKHS